MESKKYSKSQLKKAMIRHGSHIGAGLFQACMGNNCSITVPKARPAVPLQLMDSPPVDKSTCSHRFGDAPLRVRKSTMPRTPTRQVSSECSSVRHWASVGLGRLLRACFVGISVVFSVRLQGLDCQCDILTR